MTTSQRDILLQLLPFLLLLLVIISRGSRIAKGLQQSVVGNPLSTLLHLSYYITPVGLEVKGGKEEEEDVVISPV